VGSSWVALCCRVCCRVNCSLPYVANVFVKETFRVVMCCRVCCSMVYACGRTDFTSGFLSPNLQARFCKLYPAYFCRLQLSNLSKLVISKKSKSRSLYLYRMPESFFIDGSHRQKPSRLALPETRLALFPGGIFELN